MTSEQPSFQKAKKYCAYQERSQQEVRDKLYEWGLHRNEVEQIITQLISENYLNEQRFAVAYAGGKFRINGWGRLKIKQGLEAKRVSRPCITEALNKLDKRDYEAALKKLISEKTKTIKENNPFRKKHQVARYIISKGYEPELVWEILKEM
jgi:regulatory protein